MVIGNEWVEARTTGEALRRSLENQREWLRDPMGNVFHNNYIGSEKALFGHRWVRIWKSAEVGGEE